eukprot:2836413-Amphidinium_carterae.1
MYRDNIHKSREFLFEPTGVEVPVLLWRARKGYTNISEQCLSCLCEMLEIPMESEGDLTDVDFQKQLAIHLMLHFVPDLTEEQALEFFLSKDSTGADRSHEDYLDDMDDEMVSDLILAGDQPISQKFLKLRDGIKKQRDEKRNNVRRIVSHHFPKAKEIMDRPSKKCKKVETPAKIVGGSGRQYDQLKDKPKEWLIENKPPVGNVFVDESNGRFRVSYKGFNNKSFSWTGRGQMQAAQLAFSQLWSWHCSVTGQEVPANLKEFVQ